MYVIRCKAYWNGNHHLSKLMVLWKCIKFYVCKLMIGRSFNLCVFQIDKIQVHDICYFTVSFFFSLYISLLRFYTQRRKFWQQLRYESYWNIKIPIQQLYTNLTSFYCILPSVEWATITSVQDIWFNSCNHYVNCIYLEENVLCVILCIQQMNWCEPSILGHGSSIIEDTAVIGVVRLVHSSLQSWPLQQFTGL